MQLWDVNSLLPYTTQGRFTRDENGHEVWVCAVKLGWQHVKGEWYELEEPLQLFDEPLYQGEPGVSAMIHDHDFVAIKQNTDVIIAGKAKNLGKMPVSEMALRLLVEGHIDKTLRVFGDRQWVTQASTITTSHPAVFIEKNIDFTKAYGGFEERNRLGCGVGETTKQLLEQDVPSIFYPTEDWLFESQKTRPAGFGAIPPFFRERMKWAGTFNEDWKENRRPLFPADFDNRFYQSAPLDQQCNGHLEGGERIVLSGFHFEGALIFFLPKMRFEANVDYVDKGIETKEMALRTLFIDTEKEQIHACWGVSFPCQHREHLISQTQISSIRT